MIASGIKTFVIFVRRNYGILINFSSLINQMRFTSRLMILNFPPTTTTFFSTNSYNKRCFRVHFPRFSALTNVNCISTFFTRTIYIIKFLYYLNTFHGIDDLRLNLPVSFFIFSKHHSASLITLAFTYLY